MAEVHQTTVSPGKLELLTAWLPEQRWYAAKGGTPVLRTLGGYRLDDPAGEVGIEVLIVADDSEALVRADDSTAQPDAAGLSPRRSLRGSVVYQVPLTYRGEPLPGAESALVGTTEHGVLGLRYVYDGPHDPVFAAQLLELIQGRAHAQAQRVSHTADPSVQGHSVDRTPVTLASSSVLRGEQSNTSVICEVLGTSGEAAHPVIVKLFRILHPGENPDVVVQSALTEAGSTQVPQTVGSVTGEWPDPVTGERVGGHLAFAQQFLPDVEDAWRVALRAAQADTDFTSEARELGEATARIHVSLADALGTTSASPDVKAELVAVLHSRYEAAAGEMPSLLGHDTEIRTVIGRLADAEWPPLQRIHGDYHLGQVLRTHAGWVAVDFEGEPLRPLHERTRPDLALRDVAGMLRSFDYAGGAVETSRPGHSSRSWVRDCQEAFAQGYAAVTRADLVAAAPVLRALELDKALYEISYEVRNRPSWIGIPAAAIERLVADNGAQQGGVPKKGVS